MPTFWLNIALWVALAPPAPAPNSTFSVVIHQSNPNTRMRLADLQAFFAGVRKNWPDGNDVVLVQRSPNSPPYRALLERVLNMSPIEYKRRLTNIEFMGESPVNLKVLNSDVMACKYVFNVPGAIAVIETGSLHLPECTGVQVVRIDGKLPGEDGYRLR